MNKNILNQSFISKSYRDIINDQPTIPQKNVFLNFFVKKNKDIKAHIILEPPTDVVEDYDLDLEKSHPHYIGEIKITRTPLDIGHQLKSHLNIYIKLHLDDLKEELDDIFWNMQVGLNTVMSTLKSEFTFRRDTKIYFINIEYLKNICVGGGITIDGVHYIRVVDYSDYDDDCHPYFLNFSDSRIYHFSRIAPYDYLLSEVKEVEEKQQSLFKRIVSYFKKKYKGV